MADEPRLHLVDSPEERARREAAIAAFKARGGQVKTMPRAVAWGSVARQSGETYAQYAERFDAVKAEKAEVLRPAMTMRELRAGRRRRKRR